jgi:hypothetical protein
MGDGCGHARRLFEGAAIELVGVGIAHLGARDDADANAEGNGMRSGTDLVFFESHAVGVGALDVNLGEITAALEGDRQELFDQRYGN